MSYTVFARKYRPQTFQDLVGQEHVARTIANAIESGRVAHAFLFTGVRGVGKTTTARLLAKALNCEKGPTATPCNQCDPCREITNGVDMDVQEMDGASNNSVEDVRRLQESIPYRPARDRFKIVIVDEVHMLSSGAFNAFLKTLEEPPAHVKFIFATTESHKVPITIRSRCQRYDFRLIPQAVIAGRVRQILDAEGVKADEGAVAIVAREAAGSMRDALTLLDQIVAFGGEDLRGDEVARVLGIANRESITKAARAILTGDARAALDAVDALAETGVDMLHFARQLLDYVRELVVQKVTDGDAGHLSELSPEERDEAIALAKDAELLEVQRAFSSLAALVEDVGRSSAPRTVLEMGLVRLATRPPLRQVTELLARLDAIEKRLEGGGGGGGGGRRPAPGASGPGRGASEGRGAGRFDGSRSEGARVERAQVEQARTEAARTEAARTEAARTEAARTEAVQAQAAPSGRTLEPSPEDGVLVPPPGQRSAQPRSEGVVTEVGEGDLLPVWERIVARIFDARPALAAILEHGVPLAISREKIVVGFPPSSFFGKQAETPDSKEGIAESASHVIGHKPAIEVRFTAAAEPGGSGRTVAQAVEKRREDFREERRREALSHPRVQEALQVFPEGAGNVQVHVMNDGDQER